ncbi:MAG TPA: ABC transporter substrate-binding protein, partial [Lachnospiraceae bacterium]|nr:ABC transporter substrate-binding protein [Lachnospiraceae bacterium]
MNRKIKWIMIVIFVTVLAAGCGSASEAGSSLTDGEYQVNVQLTGGSGKASVESPASVAVEDGILTATIVWSSPNYDLMEVGGTSYYPVNDSGNSVFVIEIPALGQEIEVRAETVAMSEPHMIDYTLLFDFSETAENDSVKDLTGQGSSVIDLEHSDLSYATQFSLEDYGNGCTLITIIDGSRFLVVPEGEETPADLAEGITVLKQPIKNIYLAATSAMDIFVSLHALDSVKMSGTQTENWAIKEAREAMEENRILYAGKYNEPDYEMILSNQCSLAIESTMIGHAPEVREKLMELGIPVLVDYSSYEAHPLGRSEWIKLYAVLLGEEEQADELFAKQEDLLSAVSKEENTGKTIAFFYISSSGRAIIRKSGDYVSKMLELIALPCLVIIT